MVMDSKDLKSQRSSTLEFIDSLTSDNPLQQKRDKWRCLLDTMPYVIPPFVNVTRLHQFGGSKPLAPTLFVRVDGAFGKVATRDRNFDAPLMSMYTQAVYFSPFAKCDSINGIPAIFNHDSISFYYSRGKWTLVSRDDYPGEPLGFSFNHWERPTLPSELEAMETLLELDDE
jgi:hypothetical protein